jgi:hypothetical protein
MVSREERERERERDEIFPCVFEHVYYGARNLRRVLLQQSDGGLFDFLLPLRMYK